jgi:Flp pilus assembly protein TadD
MVAEHKHTTATGCIGCHMPKPRTDDVVHVVMTDHLIQRFAPPSSVLLAAKPEIFESPEASEESASSYRGEVLPYRLTQTLTPDDDLYTATAQVMQDSNSMAGIPRLAALIAERHPAQPEFAIELGDALHRRGAAAQAIDAYREALTHDPHSLRAERSLGVALAQAGAPDEALAEFQVALQDHPNDPLTWYETGLLHGQRGQLAQAIAELTKATQLDPTLAEAYNNLGIALAQNGQADAAEKAFRESLRIAPYDADTKKNLGILMASKASRPQ